MYALRSTLVVCVLSLLAGAASVAAPAQVGRPAIWTSHDLIVGLDHLPKLYSCDDLWYKFRDVLRAIGARSDMRILPYRCGRRLGSLAYSPQVHLHFSIPQTLSRTQASLADLNAAPRTVRLEPGHPASLDASDCELLRQMKDGLLAALPDRIVSFHLACDGPTTRAPFSVSIEALTPVEGQARVAARD